MRGLFLFVCLYGREGMLCVSYLCVLCDSFFEQGEARENDESVWRTKIWKFEIQFGGRVNARAFCLFVCMGGREGCV
jgi:hypothetical protein